MERRLRSLRTAQFQPEIYSHQGQTLLSMVGLLITKNDLLM
jgi:hypothetical protein